MSGFALLVVAAVWSLCHLALFAKLRVLGMMAGEKTILLFHVVAFALFAVVCFVSYLGSRDMTLTVLIGALSLHGIYSLSFLELWSLAEGGYSIGILRALSAQPRTQSSITREFAVIGDSKRESRVQAAEELGLVRRNSDTLTLTPQGRIAAVAIVLLRRAANYREPG